MFMKASRAGHNTPWSLADRNGFEHLQRCDIDHGDVVADPVCRVDPALVRVESEAPYALPDQQVARHLIALRVDHRNAVGGAERGKGQLAVAGNSYPDRLDRLGRHPRDGKGDALDDLALCRVDDADGPADLGRNPELR